MEDAAAVLAYSDEGTGPPIVFAHGMGSDRTRWESIIALLADDFRCVAVDLPGHGESPDEGCDSLSATTAIRDLVRDLGLAAPVVVGHSLGSVVALLYGALYAPRSVVAVDPVPLVLANLSDSLAPYRDRMTGGDFEAAFEEWEERFRLDLVPEPRRSILAAGFRPRAEIALSYWRGLLDRNDAVAAQPQFTTALTAIAVPTLICLADLPTPEDAAILDQMQSATIETYEGMGHFLHLVDPDRFANRLRRWIDALAT
jgi:pimeloyl-ACP methyl ester carboxylesterase